MQKIVWWNFKCNLASKKDLQQYCQILMPLIDGLDIEVCLMPQAPYLEMMSQWTLASGNIHIGIQDIACEVYGSYTGDTSIQAVSDLGLWYVLVGHADRIDHHHENRDIISHKIKLVSWSSAKVILCLWEKEPSLDLSTIIHDMQTSIDHIKHLIDHDHVHIDIAYEPRRAIGKDQTPDLSHLSTLISTLKYHSIWYPIRFLYGASVSRDNISAIMDTGVDGVLVGKSSLDPHHFADIVHIVASSS